MLKTTDNIYVAGHRGMVGSAMLRRLKADGYKSIITRTRTELDLTNQQAVDDFFKNEKIDAVILAAARVGGIHANNTYRGEFIYENLMIECNIIHAAMKAGVENLLYLGSSCIYPRNCPQPIKEEYLLSGYLEPTNEPYGIAKIAGIKMCEAYNHQYGTRYRSVMPTNLYGPNDNYDLENSHVLPALICKFHLARLAHQKRWDEILQDEKIHGKIPDDIKAALGLDPSTSQPVYQLTNQPTVVLWGTGTPRREFLHVDDMVDACLFVMNLSDDQYASACALNGKPKGYPYESVPHLNIGCGEDATIRLLADQIRQIVGFEGVITWDDTKPDGMPRKMLDVSRLNSIGWQPRISLKDGITKTYQRYKNGLEQAG